MIADLQDIRGLVERIEAELGPDADPRDVEAIAAQLMARTAEPVLQGTLYISLADCSSRLLSTVRTHAYDKVRRIASHLRPLLDGAATEAGFAAGGFAIHTSPVALAAPAAGSSDFLAIAADFEAAAEQCGAEVIHGFAAVAERHASRSARAFVDSLPAAFRSTRRVHAALHCGSARHGLNLEAVTMASHLYTTEMPSGRFSLAYNAADVVPVGPDAALTFRIDLAPILSAGDTLSGEAASRVEAVAGAGRRCAEMLRQRSGLDVVFDGVESDGMTRSLVEGGNPTMRIRPPARRLALALPDGTSESALVPAAAEAMQNEAFTLRPFFLHLFVGGHAGDVVDLGPPFGEQAVRRAY